MYVLAALALILCIGQRDLEPPIVTDADDLCRPYGGTGLAVTEGSSELRGVCVRTGRDNIGTRP